MSILVCAGACMYICVEASGWHWVSSSGACYLVLWDKISHWTLSSQIGKDCLASGPMSSPVSYSLPSIPGIPGSDSDPHACNRKWFTDSALPPTTIC